MADDESPLIKTLPPETDYLTYLTLVEMHLGFDNLHILHRVLQDEKLTTNIGWDLVHLLVPLLPDSEQCLQDIARLGNPREVILKVIESLRLIEYDVDDADEDDFKPLLESNGNGDVRAQAESSTYPLKTASTTDAAPGSGTSQAVELPPPLPLATSQFIALLAMLAILHPRIKTQYPSRFLSSTLQAILASFSNSTSHREEMILSIAKIVKAVSGTKRPALPSRQSSGMLSSGPTLKTTAPAGDPEALASSDADPEESALQLKLLQSFLTHIVEEYMLNLDSTSGDVPGMAWCSRIMEKLHPDRTIPEKETFAERFANEEMLHRRIDAVGQLVTLARDLKLTDADLIHAAVMVEKVPSQDGIDEDDPPDSAEDVALSRLGSLILYTARRAAGVLYDTPATSTAPQLATFPQHQEILKNCLASIETSTGHLGTEPEALIDAVLALGMLCLEDDAIGEPQTNERFNEYLQVTALLSSNCPSPTLRGHAHYLTSTILRSQPDEKARLAFIRDTLEHCPFENLKVSAVGWIKGETIEANPPQPVLEAGSATTAGEERSVFATPLALDSLAPFLFPSVHADLVTPPIRDAYMIFRTNLSFYLASLNLLYLLLCAKHLHSPLAISDLWTNNDIAGSFLSPLRECSGRFAAGLEEGGSLDDETSAEALAELNVLDQTLERVTKAAAALNG